MIEFIAANWLWVMLIVAVVFMHRRGHGDETAARDEPADAGGLGLGSHR